ncbi:soluble NSF attachment protein, partial [Leptodontidium sp. 2 PMI_412]
KLSEPNVAVNTLVEAFKSYRMGKPQDAVHCLGLAIQQFATTGLLRREANCQQMATECYEKDRKEYFRAIEASEPAAAWLEKGTDNVRQARAQCHRKIGELAGYLENWPKAIMSFELVASEKSWLAKECLFKAGLAHLAMMDMVSFDRWIERYASMEPSFSNSK